MSEPKTLLQAIQYFSDEKNCREFVIAMRWPDDKVRCPRCGSEKVAWLEKAKLYFCSVKHPKQKFSLKVGTIFEDSPIGLEKWLPAMWLLCNAKNGISSYELHRALGVTQKTAWFMLHRIREALKNKSVLKLGSSGGPVEVDEAFIGPNLKKMHASKRQALKRGMSDTNQAVVMGMLDRESREVRATVVPNVTRATLQNEILNHIAGGSTVYTDGYVSYDRLAAKAVIHETENHVTAYVRGQVHTQGIENFWSLLKRTLRGTYVAVEPFHLDQYLS